MKDTVDIFLIRHGQCVANTQGVFVGDTEDPLTNEGIAQANRLHNKFKKMHLSVNAVFTSTAVRANQTAKIVFPGHSLIRDARLLEVNAGSLAQKRHSTPINHQDYLHQAFPEGESYTEMYKRVCDWFHSIPLEPNTKIAIVAHGGSLVMLMLHILNGHPERFPMFQLNNASVTHIVTSSKRDNYFFEFINHSPAN